ncbi:helix-turn-helix transcriptional regulator [Vibrio sp. S9_S30]|uniref:LuxR C-terminal-related transcriptional regulator n=1 Tax=Vibrio sp. S9_S30 TaxID=2720226 RepID=UPI001681B54B|nr:LuxR C-terminal-related transcriptional regulator [Vibrio sp. S9_S30]MBD1556218.1 helix-turn-helix transcriptional regulator [Vibrio sp. S9_S30]
MDNTSNKANIIFITNKNIQSNYFKSYVESNVPLLVTVVDYDGLESELLTGEEYIALVDLSVKDNIDWVASALAKSEGLMAVVLLNGEQEIEFKELVKWKKLHGCFGAKDDLDSVCNGLLSISRGENWLPRKAINQLLSFYQKNDSSYMEDEAIQVDLTRREIEILETLKTGESNIEIADKLFISEHTIKSHLYNIFKKIEVKNRLQAMAWAKKHL